MGMPAAPADIAPDVSAQDIAAIVSRHTHLEGPLLQILHEVQNRFGHVPDTAIIEIAAALNLTRAEVFGVKSFYHDFTDKPVGRHRIKVCRAEACQASGGRETSERLKAALGLDWHETSADGAVRLDPVYCLGLCSCAPAALVDGELRGRLDDEAIDEIVAEVRS